MQVDLLQVIQTLMAAQNLQVTLSMPPFDGLEKFDFGLRQSLDPVFDWKEFGRTLLKVVPQRTLIFTEDIFELHFAIFRLPDWEDTVCIIGPWVTGPRTEEQMHRLKQLIGEKATDAVQEFYNGVRLADTAQLAPQITALVSMTNPEEGVEVRETQEFLPLNFRPDTRYFNEPAFEQEIPAAMLERRYAAENRLLEAIGRGDTEAALLAMNHLFRFRIQGRFSETPEQTKSLLTVFNTLFRKTIEGSTVHPYYIDEISGRYGRRIENMTVADRNRMLSDMVREYCAYVREYSLKEYSPLVQKVINHINLNLDTELSLKSLAAMCYISPSYLSNLFKRETGTTLIDYINTQRTQRAARLLVATKQSVAAIAAQVGILDVNYFARLFKKALGQTPTQYRRAHPAES